MRQAALLLSLSLVASTGCGVCTTSLEAGILVMLDEDIEDVTITATHGSFSETVDPLPGATEAGLAWERPGTYHLEVKAPGYVTWTAVVGVVEDDCHVDTVVVTPELVPIEG